MIVLLCCVLFFANEKQVIAAEAWVVLDAKSGRILQGKQEHRPLPIASLTKIWTAFTVLESAVPQTDVTISKEASMVEGSSIYLKENEIYAVDTLLYGLMLRSGNDAAYALAEHIGFTVEGFVHLMNTHARYYKLRNTFFTNPTGLSEERHISTAYETALMMKYAMENEQFRKIASTKKFETKVNDETIHWRNKHKLLHANKYAVAGKTGYTKQAGRTLVTYFERGNKEIIVVTLNDGNDWVTHEELAAEVFSTYKNTTIAKEGKYSIAPNYVVQLEQPIELLLAKGEKKEAQQIIQIPRNDEQQVIGKWKVYMGEQEIVNRKVVVERQ